MESNNSGMRVFFLLFDLFLLNVSAYMVFHNSPMYNYVDLPGRNFYILHANASELLAYILYSKRNYFFTDKYSDRVKSFSVRFIILLIIQFVLAEVFLPDGYHKGFLIEYTVFFFVVKVTVFYFIYKYQRYRYSNGHTFQRVAILGMGNSSQLLGKLINNNPSLGFRLVGYINDMQNMTDYCPLGTLEDLNKVSERYKINMLFVTNPKYFTKKTFPFELSFMSIPIIGNSQLKISTITAVEKIISNNLFVKRKVRSSNGIFCGLNISK